MGGIYYIEPGAESLTLTLQDDILTPQNIADKLKALGWKPLFDVEEGFGHTLQEVRED